MEEDSPFEPSVAELAGRFRGHTVTPPTSAEARVHQRKLPCCLKLSGPRDDKEGESQKPVILPPKPFKVKINSSIIEKLQANLALSPGSLLPSPRTPEVKLQRPPSPPSVPCTPPTPDTSPSPPPHVRQSSEEEEAVCFESPPEGAPLPSFNKTRARLSFARRPPSRRHRRSPEEERVGGNGPSPWQPEPAGPGVEGGSGRDEPSRGRPSRDPAVRPHQSEGEEEDRAQMAGGEDVAERADDVTPRGAGPEATAGQTEVTTQDALRREEREAA